MNPAHEHNTFIDWGAPALPAAAAHLAQRYARGDELALRGCVLVVPGARAGRRLKELLVEEAEARGLRLAPPRITTSGALPELLYESEHPVADPVLCVRHWSRALRSVAPERLRLLFPDPPEPADVRGWLELGRQVDALHRDIAGAGHTFRDVAAVCGTDLLYDDSNRWETLAEVQDAYVRSLRTAGRADLHNARMAAVAAGTIACESDIRLIGVAELPALVRRMLLSLPAGRVRALIHAPESMAHAFDALGCVEPTAWADAEVPVTDDQLIAADRPADQAVAALDGIADLEGAYAADDIVIMVADEEVVPYLEERLDAGGVATRYAAGTDLRRTGPYRLLGAIADVLDGGSAESWAALVRHPEFSEWLRTRAPRADHRGAPVLQDRDGALDPLDQYLSEHLPSRLDRRLPAGRSRGAAAVQALLQVVNGPEMLGGLRGRRPLGEWMPHVLDLLLRVYGERTLDRGTPAERTLLAAFGKLRDAAAALHRVPAGMEEACDVATAIRVLLDDARGEMLPADPDRAAVELLGWLELHLDDAPVAVLTGVNEPFLPASINADAFLPDSLRTVLGLADNARRYARDAYQLTAVLESRRVRVIAGLRSASGDPLRPSRLLLTGGGEPLARRVKAFFGGDATHETREKRSVKQETPAAPAAPGAGDAVGSPPSTSGFVLPPVQVLRAPAPLDRISVTAFRSLLADPYVFALEHVLRLREAHDAARELDPLRFGDLAHTVLQLFGSAPELHSADPRAIARRLNELLDAEAERRFGRAVRPAVRLQVEQLRARLARFADTHAARTADGWRVVGVECATGEEGVPFEVDGEPIRIRGRIDRIDYHAATGRWAVLDYKTGEKATVPDKAHRRGRDPAVWVDLQLPMYRHILHGVRDAHGSAVFAGSPDTVELGYVLLCAEADGIGVAMADWSPDDLREADLTAHECVRLLRHNVFAYDDGTARTVRGDLAALLGAGRLTGADDDEEEADDELELEVSR